MIVERLTAAHILGVQVQPAQAAAIGMIDLAYAEALLAQRGVGWAVVDNGSTLACGGIVEAWPDRALSWALFSTESLAKFRHVHRLVTSVLRDAPWRRIEMDVDAAHAAGCHWAERLGFVAEGVRRKYTTDGRDVVLYARVK